MSDSKSILYIVATPLGNLGDISARALQVLQEVDLIVAEDTRHSQTLLQHFGIGKPIISLHEHNERQRVPDLIKRLQSGEVMALISDAGTPLLNDPGYILVTQAWAEGIKVSPIPGPSAIIAALSAAGLPTHRFIYEGFLPAKQQARQKELRRIARHDCTSLMFESTHRIYQLLSDINEVVGSERPLVIAREMTKRYETFLHGGAEELMVVMQNQPEQKKGEFVVMMAAAPDAENDRDDLVNRCLAALLEVLPVKESVALAVKITGAKRNQVYRLALEKTKEQ